MNEQISKELISAWNRIKEAVENHVGNDAEKDIVAIENILRLHGYDIDNPDDPRPFGWLIADGGITK